MSTPTGKSWIDNPYCTDEDLALRASGDYAQLCPSDQLLAYGQSGYTGPGSPWVLRDDSQDLTAAGLKPGQVVLLSKPTQVFRPPAHGLVIDSIVAADSLQSGGLALRRKGLLSGEGWPPGGNAGVSGVEYRVTTLLPQIRDACYDLDRRFGVDDLVVGRRFVDEYDPSELRQATVLTVLWKQYLAMAAAGDAAADSFRDKATRLKAELDELLGRVVLHWAPQIDAQDPPTTKFGMRISR